ncbi:MAG: DUF3536 domain-containing protein, partial [Candidatus Acidiferrales bacterium]
MERYVCIHAHFYQPPRENPWLEAIEQQESARPYHDWNERVTAECYAPNTAARIQGSDGRIASIVNNFATISFNVGPTLLAWLEALAPDTYRAIIAADQESMQRFSGHGSALAQVYNHTILPLGNRRDKQTQIRWGIRDFERRFGRKPEGMWLSETAVDLESLDLLAEHGIRFTVLAPSQAKRARKLGAKSWQDVSNQQFDPSRAYLQTLASGRSIALFFYDGPISRAVAFEGLLKSGETFASRLISAFSDGRDWPQLAHIATDGETYGHHHAHGEMALAYAIHQIESKGLARVTNYGEYLERHPPENEVEIFENSSWSCVHGVERWRSDCGCNSGGRSDWNQKWRGPLREALDWLRDQLAPLFEREAGRWLRDPWAARDAYIEVLLDRSEKSVAQFLHQHAQQPLEAAQESRVLKLLELQRHAMLMYTSCGWFFDELSGIETLQVMQYAGRAMQLGQELFGDSIEEQSLARLERAPSNVPEHGHARAIYEKFVRPAMLDLEKVGAHYAVSSLFESYAAETRTYCYEIAREDFRLLSSGRARLALGRARIRSLIDRDATTVSFGVFHLGDHNVSGGVRSYQGEEAYAKLCDGLTQLFDRGDYHALLHETERTFGRGTYTLKLLFRDERLRILSRILESARMEADAAYRQLYEHYATLLHFLTDVKMARPRRLQAAAEFTLNSELLRALEAEPLELEAIRARLAEAAKAGVTLDAEALEFRVRRTLERMARRLAEKPHDVAQLQALEAAVDLAASLPFEVNLWTPQNVYFSQLKPLIAGQRAQAEGG